jgi:hypothetical protein
MQYPNGSTGAPNQKLKKETKKRKDPLWYFSPSSNNTSTTKTTPELQALQKRCQCTSIIIARSKILGFHPEDSPHSQNNAFNKDIARYNQLRSNLGFSS